MVDVFFPETGSVFIAGSNYAFNIQSYKEDGGTQTRTFIRTMSRNFRRFTGPITDWEVSFVLSITGSEFDDLYDKVGSVGSISLDFDCSYKTDYFNMYNVSLNKSADAPSYLTSSISFLCAPYDSNGSKNKVIT